MNLDSSNKHQGQFQLTRRRFLQITGKGLAALGILPPLPDVPLLPSTTSTDVVGLNAATLLSFIQSAAATRETTNLLNRHILVRYIPKSPMIQGIHSQGMFEFNMCAEIIESLGEKGSFTLFQDEGGVSHLASLAQPKNFPGLALTPEQIANNTKGFAKAVPAVKRAWFSKDFLASSLNAPPYEEQPDGLAHHVSSEFGNAPTETQQRAWESLMTQRREVTALIKSSCLKEDEKFFTFLQFICDPTGIPDSSKKLTISNLTHALCTIAHDQKECLAGLQTLAERKPLHPYSFVWDVVKKLAAPDAETTILSMPSIVLRGRYFATIEYLEWAKRVKLEFIEKGELPYKDLFEVEDALRGSRIKIPPSLKNRADKIYRDRIREQRLDEKRTLELNVPEDTLLSLCRNTRSQWSKGTPGRAQGKLENWERDILARISFKDRGWRLNFRA